MAVDIKPNGDPISGTYMDKELALEFAVSASEVGLGTVKIRGILAEDGSLSGGRAFQDYSGKYKATRVKH
jgi:hypothetical protein